MLHHAIILLSYNKFAKLCDHVSSGLLPVKLQKMTKNTHYNENSTIISIRIQQEIDKTMLVMS